MTFDLIDQNAQIQSQIIEYLNLEEDNEEMFEKLIRIILQKYQIGREKYELELLLCLLVRIFNNMHRTSTFFDKIFKILNYIKEDISKNFTNEQIYEIFKSNKRLLLFLIDERILTVDQNIASKLSCKVAKYFYYEIQPFGYLTDFKLPIDKSEFERLRKNGEDHQKICELIRNDLLDDFIVFINQYSIKSTKMFKNSSIFETNQYLQDRPKSLIEYAAFFGSIKIFIYLRNNDAELKPSSILFAIHGQNAEIIDFLLNKFPNQDNSFYIECFFEAIKCYDNDIAIYIRDNFLNDIEIKNNDLLSLFNFNFIDKSMILKLFFDEICELNNVFYFKYWITRHSSFNPEEQILYF